MCNSIEFNNPIIINESNRNRIGDTLNKIQRRANSRLYSLNDIFNFINLIEEYKQKHYLSWSDLEDCRFSFDTYVTMPNCYKYQISYTCINVVIKGSKVRIYSMFRSSDFNKKKNVHRYQATYLTEIAKEKIVENCKYM